MLYYRVQRNGRKLPGGLATSQQNLEVDRKSVGGCFGARTHAHADGQSENATPPGPSTALAESQNKQYRTISGEAALGTGTVGKDSTAFHDMECMDTVRREPAVSVPQSHSMSWRGESANCCVVVHCDRGLAPTLIALWQCFILLTWTLGRGFSLSLSPPFHAP